MATAKMPDNDSLVQGKGGNDQRHYTDLDANEVNEVLAAARGNLSSWQITGDQQRIGEAEENAAYLEALREQKEK